MDLCTSPVLLLHNWFLVVVAYSICFSDLLCGDFRKVNWIESMLFSYTKKRKTRDQENGEILTEEQENFIGRDSKKCVVDWLWCKNHDSAQL